MPAHTRDIAAGKPRRPHLAPARRPHVPVVAPRRQPRRIPGRR
ncbi:MULTISPECIES: hypothetical protein [Micromonospora]|nr:MULTISPECIES: hypothetical protein [Micromonospora]ADL47018.1 hypothetical protein Micau_3491 [Micromonospora aurantiaca ATCC 27029]